MQRQTPRTIFFDYDGTLHDSLAIYAPAFRQAYQYLVTTYDAPRRTWSDDEIKPFLGQPPSVMWNQFGDAIPEKGKKEASKMIGEDMRRRIQNNEARLYEGAIDTLRYLKDKGYTLVFISNCLTYYMKAHSEMFNLSDYFDRMVCSETFAGIEEKTNVLAHIKPEFEEPMMIVGDRYHDFEAGRDNDIATIAASYGFGDARERANTDRIIDDIRELQKML